MEHEQAIGRTGGPSSDMPRNARSPSSATAPAEWVRKERLGKKGEFRYF